MECCTPAPELDHKIQEYIPDCEEFSYPYLTTLRDKLSFNVLLETMPHILSSVRGDSVVRELASFFTKEQPASINATTSEDSDSASTTPTLTLSLCIHTPWTTGCFSDGACLCFRLPSLSSGARVLPRSGCGIPGLSEGGHDYISARSMRQYH